MIKVKGMIEVDKCDLEKISAGKCSSSGGGIEVDCNSFNIHFEPNGAIQADDLHIHL